MNCSATPQKYILAYAKRIALIYLENVFDMFSIFGAWEIFLIPNIMLVSSKVMLLKNIKISNIIGIAICLLFLLVFTVITTYSVIANLLRGARTIEKGAIISTGVINEIKKSNIIKISNIYSGKSSIENSSIFKVDYISPRLEIHKNICIAHFNNTIITPLNGGVKNAVGVWAAEEVPTYKISFPCPANYRMIFRILYIIVVIAVALVLTELLKWIIIQLYLVT